MIRLASLQSVGYIDVKIKVLFYDHSAGVTYTTEEIEMRMVTGVYAVGNRSTDLSPTYPSDQYRTYLGGILGDIARFEEPPNRIKWSISNLLLSPSDTIKIVWSARYNTNFPIILELLAVSFQMVRQILHFRKVYFLIKFRTPR
jgi:hypothetical protein